ncbi:MAG: hypothetical protein M3P52_12635 [Actinomycetota bacterium]|nr:hypothetical protein [Actinomycetota bacterium]
MSNTEQLFAEHRHAQHRTWLITAAVAIAVVGASAAAIAVATSADTSAKSFGGRTGEINSMGMPVLETPGTSSGTVKTAAITATPSLWALGIVPLDVAVRPTWQLDNTGTDPITIGEPHAQVNQGCCPGAFTLDGPSTLDPGAEANLSFELSMHPGMDGPHDITVHVPLQHADGITETINLSVTGDFRN